MGVLKTVAIDGMGDGAFCVGLNDPLLSNEQVLLKANSVVLPAGTQLGKFTSGGDAGKYTPIVPGASDGSQIWAGTLFGRKEISTSDQKAVIVARRQVVNANALTYINSVNSGQKATIEATMASAMVMARY